MGMFTKTTDSEKKIWVKEVCGRGWKDVSEAGGL